MRESGLSDNNVLLSSCNSKQQGSKGLREYWFSCRVAYADYLCLALGKAAAIFAVCPTAAARLADLDQHHLHQIIAWAIAVWPELNSEDPIALALSTG